jgi:NADH:ubiquinone oxidoreductase subunit 6 (subunit J)
MKIILVLAFIGILMALAAAGLFMLKNGSGANSKRGPKMARALAIRVGVSVALFLFILLSYWMGWIQPTGLPVRP